VSFLTILKPSGAAPTATKVWVKIGGVWKEATVYLKVAGVWKTSTPKIKASGTWK
jgi:hypothetical protein